VRSADQVKIKGTPSDVPNCGAHDEVFWSFI